MPEENSATYTVRLATEPVGGNATVTITGAADGIAPNPTRLVFTSRNWDTPRQVRVSAANDNDSTNEVVTLSHAASGADYGGVPTAAIVVTATDDDTPSLNVSPTRLTVRENRTATYTMRLNTQPSASVTVSVSGTTAEVTVDETALTFTTTNWNATRTVTVSAADDDNATDETVNLLHAATGGDYTGLALASRPGVEVSVDDDDTPALAIDPDPNAGPLALNEMSGHADNAKNYTVRLATQPTAQVEVAVSSDDRAVSVDNDATPQTRTLTFTTTNWATAQAVTATAAEDDDASNETVTITHTATGGDYDDVSAQLRATTLDDDEPAIVVVATGLVASGVMEGGEATYTVRLDTEPAGVARLSVAAEGPVSVDLDRNQAGVQPWLRFDATNWNTPRTASVRGLDDADARIRHGHPAPHVLRRRLRRRRGGGRAVLGVRHRHAGSAGGRDDGGRERRLDRQLLGDAGRSPDRRHGGSDPDQRRRSDSDRLPDNAALHVGELERAAARDRARRLGRRREHHPPDHRRRLRLGPDAHGGRDGARRRRPRRPRRTDAAAHGRGRNGQLPRPPEHGARRRRDGDRDQRQFGTDPAGRRTAGRRADADVHDGQLERRAAGAGAVHRRRRRGRRDDDGDARGRRLRRRDVRPDPLGRSGGRRRPGHRLRPAGGPVPDGRRRRRDGHVHGGSSPPARRPR